MGSWKRVATVCLFQSRSCSKLCVLPASRTTLVIDASQWGLGGANFVEGDSSKQLRTDRWWRRHFRRRHYSLPQYLRDVPQAPWRDHALGFARWEPGQWLASGEGRMTFATSLRSCKQSFGKSRHFGLRCPAVNPTVPVGTAPWSTWL